MQILKKECLFLRYVNNFKRYENNYLSMFNIFEKVR